MPNPTITSSSYAGEFAGKYLAASLLTAKTLDDAAITIMPNIKYKAAMKVGTFSNLVRSADCNFDSATSGLNLQEKILTPTELQVNLEICKKSYIPIGKLLRWGLAPILIYQNYSLISLSQE